MADPMAPLAGVLVFSIILGALIVAIRETRAALIRRSLKHRAIDAAWQLMRWRETRRRR